MAFVEVVCTKPKSSSSYTGDKVKLHFPVINKKVNVMLTIGKDIINQLGFKHQDKLVLSIDDLQAELWWLHKNSTSKNQRTLVDIYHNSTTSNKVYRYQFVWKQEVPNKFRNNDKLYLTWKIHQGGLMLTLPTDKSKEYTE